jgi:hypothetical protein
MQRMEVILFRIMVLVECDTVVICVLLLLLVTHQWLAWLSVVITRGAVTAEPPDALSPTVHGRGGHATNAYPPALE